MTRHLLNPRLLAAVGLVVLLLAVALWPSAVAVDVAPVERGALRVTVDEEAETRVRDRFVVSAPVAGRVLRIDLEPGDRVQRGRTVLATFRPAAPNPLDVRTLAEARAALAAAEAAVGRMRAEHRRAEQALSLARTEQERTRALFGQQILSRQVLDVRETETRSAEEALRAAEFAVRAAEHEREMARARQLAVAAPASGAGGGEASTLVIRSPIDGVVFKRLRESETTVNAGEPLLELGDPQQLEIVSDLLSTDAVKVRGGQRVIVEHWGGDGALHGRVRLVEPSGFMKISALGVEEQRVNVIIDIVDPPAAIAALGDGYRVEVAIVVWEAEDVVRVPASALFRRGEKWAVFAMEGNRARLRVVELGRRNGLEAQVLSGVEPGAQVVVHPSDALSDGSRITRRPSA